MRRSSSGSSLGEAARMAARPLPIPRVFDEAPRGSASWKSALRCCWMGLGDLSATGGDLFRELEVSVRTGAVGIVMDHRLAEARSLADAHVAWDDSVEHE